MSDDRYPKAHEELEAENVALRATVGRLQESVARLQSVIVARETEIMGLRRPKSAPRVLSNAAKDKFERPGRWRS